MSLCGRVTTSIRLGKDGRSAGTVQVGDGGRRRIRKQVLGDAHNKVADKLGDLQRLHRENRSTGVSAAKLRPLLCRWLHDCTATTLVTTFAGATLRAAIERRLRRTV